MHPALKIPLFPPNFFSHQKLLHTFSLVPPHPIMSVTSSHSSSQKKTIFCGRTSLPLCFRNQNYEMYGMVDESEPCPPQFINTDLNPAYTKWVKKDRTCRIWLIASLSESVLPFTVGSTSARSLWLTLELRLSALTRSHVLQLKRRIQTIQKGSLSITDYLQQIKTVADALAAAGAPLDDSDLVAHTLHGLTDDYDAFTTSIRVRSDPVTADELHGLLLSQEIEIAHRANPTSLLQPNNNNSQAFTASTSSRPRTTNRVQNLNSRFYQLQNSLPQQCFSLHQLPESSANSSPFTSHSSKSLPPYPEHQLGYSCQKMLEDMNPLSIGFYWDSFDDGKFYDLVFSDDPVENTEEMELQVFLSDAIPMLTGHLGDASTRLSCDNFPLTKKAEHIDKKSSVDGLNKDESKEFQELLSDGIDIHAGHIGDALTKLFGGNFPQPKKEQQREKKGAERASLLFKSMSQFNDIDFFLNPRTASTAGNSDCAVTAVNKIAPCTKGEQSHSICAQVEHRNEQKSKELLNSFPCLEEYKMRSKEDSDQLRQFLLCHLQWKLTIQQSIMSFPETVIVVNTQNLDKEMIVSRRLQKKYLSKNSCNGEKRCTSRRT